MLLEGTSTGEAAPTAGSAAATPQPTGGSSVDQTIQTANQTTATSGRRGISGPSTTRSFAGGTPQENATACPEGETLDEFGQCMPTGGGGEEPPPEEIPGGGGTTPDDIAAIKDYWAKRGMPWGENDPDPWYSFDDFNKYMGLWESNGSVAGLSDEQLAAHAHATIDGRFDKAWWSTAVKNHRDDNCPAKRPFAADCNAHPDQPCPSGACLEKPQDWGGGGGGGAGGGGGGGGGGGEEPGYGTGSVGNPNYDPGAAAYTTYDQAQLDQLAAQAGANDMADQARNRVQAAIPGGTKTTGSIWPSVLNM